MLYVLTHSLLRIRDWTCTKWMSLSLAVTRAPPSFLSCHKVRSASTIEVSLIFQDILHYICWIFVSRSFSHFSFCWFSNHCALQSRKLNSQRRTSKLFPTEFNLEVMRSSRRRTVQDQPLSLWWVRAVTPCSGASSNTQMIKVLTIPDWNSSFFCLSSFWLFGCHYQTPLASSTSVS